MQGIIFDIKHFAVHDGPGIRQTVFLKGCPLNCWWCHNPESQNSEPESYIKINKLNGKEFRKKETAGYTINSSELFNIIQGDKIFFEESGGGVTFSGGEPLVQSKFLFKTAKICKKNNIHTCIDTSGFASEKTIIEASEIFDLFLFDLKIIQSENHQKYTGVPVEPILKNLKWLDQNHKNVILRFPVIPGITNTKENLAELKAFLETLKNINQIDILPYHNIHNGKYERFNKKNKMGLTEPLKESEIKSLKKEFESIGFKTRIGG